jgi:hypothetical protein
MDDRERSAGARGRWLMLAAILALGVVIGGILYVYSDDLIALAQSLTSGKLGRPEGKLRY